MPLDFANKSITLNDELLWMGINPVPDLVLDKHKKDEVAKHPGDWLFRFIPVIHGAIAMGLLLSLFGGVAGLLIGTFEANLNAFMIGIVGITTMLMLVAFVTYIDIRNRTSYMPFGKFKGPATWRETTFNFEELHAIPMPLEIRRIVRKTAGLRGATFVVGELHQESRMLDPYVLVRVDGKTACLGVWDGAKIIHIAEVI